jgi:cysteine desulfurase/selenocysteine lyase
VVDLNVPDAFVRRDDLGARADDVFGTANFLNFMPWAAAIEYLLGHGIEQISSPDAQLVDLLIGLASSNYGVVGPSDPRLRSATVAISHEDPRRNEAAHESLSRAGIDIALRSGNLRFSPHLYNTPSQIRRALDVLITEA